MWLTREKMSRRLSNVVPGKDSTPMSDNRNYTETFTEIDGRIRYRRMVPSVPEWKFFTVELWLTKSFVESISVNAKLSRKYLDYAVNHLLKKNGIS